MSTHDAAVRPSPDADVPTFRHSTGFALDSDADAELIRRLLADLCDGSDDMRPELEAALAAFEQVVAERDEARRQREALLRVFAVMGSRR